jgi:hypothetical protein
MRRQALDHGAWALRHDPLRAVAAGRRGARNDGGSRPAARHRIVFFPLHP